MKFKLFYHSLVSDWNHGNAHFLRGVVTDLIERGHDVEVFEPEGAWSRANLVQEHGNAPIEEFHARYPKLRSRVYSPDLDLDRALDGADVVIVHEWSKPALVERVGQHRLRSGKYLLFFHDTHHRAVSAPEEMQNYDLSHYDAVLAFGGVIRDLYLQRGWAQRAFVWHEAADTRLFKPIPAESKAGDLVWVGNWGDGERSAELQAFLLEPIRRLKLRSRIYGVRYPEQGLKALARANVEYGGWLANYEVPETFGRYRVTVHVPRRPYVEALPGIPTIRPFEALACGIPLICSPWNDSEHLFRVGHDFLQARDTDHMCELLNDVLHDPALAATLARNGRETIEARHTCHHRVDELLALCDSLSDSLAAGKVLP